MNEGLKQFLKDCDGHLEEASTAMWMEMMKESVNEWNKTHDENNDPYETVMDYVKQEFTKVK